MMPHTILWSWSFMISCYMAHIARVQPPLAWTHITCSSWLWIWGRFRWLLYNPFTGECDFKASLLCGRYGKGGQWKESKNDVTRGGGRVTCASKLKHYLAWLTGKVVFPCPLSVSVCSHSPLITKATLQTTCSEITGQFWGWSVCVLHFLQRSFVKHSPPFLAWMSEGGKLLFACPAVHAYGC